MLDGSHNFRQTVAMNNEADPGSLEDKVNTWTANWLRRHEPTPRTLFHYTTPAGFLGILESQKVWATDARFLNDSTELVYAEEVISSVLSADWDHYRGEAVRTLLSRGQHALDGADPFVTGVHVVCFCEQGDLLSQWRGYGGQGGYALGFIGPLLTYMSPQPVALRKVIYDRSEQEALIANLVQPFCEYLSNLGPTDGCVHGWRGLGAGRALG